jgi:hypothetical protein
MDCHNHYRNNQDQNKDKKTKKEGTKLSHLTMPSRTHAKPQQPPSSTLPCL